MGEGCFTVSISENHKLKVGWKVMPSFQIVLHEKDLPLLVRIKKALGVGKITRLGPSAVRLQVQSLKEVEAIINHFDQFPLITNKRAYFKALK